VFWLPASGVAGLLPPSLFEVDWFWLDGSGVVDAHPVIATSGGVSIKKTEQRIASFLLSDWGLFARLRGNSSQRIQ
jgi:hypothetical protein